MTQALLNASEIALDALFALRVNPALNLKRDELEKIEHAWTGLRKAMEYTKTDKEFLDAAKLITDIETRLDKEREILSKITNQAIEHWPDAENWPVIIAAQELLGARS